MRCSPRTVGDSRTSRTATVRDQIEFEGNDVIGRSRQPGLPGKACAGIDGHGHDCPALIWLCGGGGFSPDDCPSSRLPAAIQIRPMEVDTNLRNNRAAAYLLASFVAVSMVAMIVIYAPAIIAPNRTDKDLANIANPETMLTLIDSRLKLQNDVRTSLMKGIAGAAVLDRGCQELRGVTRPDS
jgi:hypothetical protein